MLVYAKQYNRQTGLLARGLWDELTCLNNRFVFLLPTYSAIRERFLVRGDEFQDERSLEKLHNLFGDHDWIGAFPNVTLLDNSETGLAALNEAVEQVESWIRAKEEYNLDEISDEVRRFVSMMPTGSPDDMRGYESQISLTFYDDCRFEEVDPGILLHPDDGGHPEEGEYYKRLRDDLISKIEAELDGLNEYEEKQTGRSRRFVHAEDTCISFMQVMFRNGVMDFHVVFRSTNVVKTFPSDLQFIYALAHDIHTTFGRLPPVRSVRFRVDVNSAHLVR